jgi:hypothetical protein
MGEVADMMINGDMCEGCGGFLGGGDGHPRRCSYCMAEELGTRPAIKIETTTRDGQPISRPSKINCPHCRKLVKIVGLKQHIKAVHEG